MLEIRFRDGNSVKASMGNRVQVGGIGITPVVEGVVFEHVEGELKRLSVYDCFKLGATDLNGEIEVPSELQVTLPSRHTASLSGHYVVRVEKAGEYEDALELVEQVFMTIHCYDCTDGQVVS